MVDLSVIGVLAQDGNDAPLLMLHPPGIRKVICLRVSPVEALAASMALRECAGGIAFPSALASELPGSSVFFGLLSHELMARIVEALGGRLLAVELPRMEGVDFTAELVLKTPTGLARLCCRPADGITLALRCGAMIRMPKHLLAHAEDMDTIMNALSGYVRSVIEEKLSSLPLAKSGEKDGSRVPPEVEAALADAGASDLADPRSHIVNAAKKILEQQGLHASLEKILNEIKLFSADHAQSSRVPKVEVKLVSAGRGDARSAPPAAGGIRISAGERVPAGADNRRAAAQSRSAIPHLADDGAKPQKGARIRIALVRQGGEGEPEVLDEFHFPAEGISGNTPSGAGSPGPESGSLSGEPSDEDRWAMLLRMLSPETKVPM